jgi:hypothetical protein
MRDCGAKVYALKCVIVGKGVNAFDDDHILKYLNNLQSHRLWLRVTRNNVESW